MAAGLVVPVSGPYLGTFNSRALGVLNDDGFVITCTVRGQSVEETDQLGLTLVEGVYRGQNWRCRLRGLEWENGLLNALQMFGQTVAGGDTLDPTLSPAGHRNIGALWTTYCKPMVLTAILGDPPSSTQSLTATNAGLAPEQQSEFMMTSKVRELPLEFVFLPYTTTIGSTQFDVPFTTI